jgi:hypothetical protein
VNLAAGAELRQMWTRGELTLAKVMELVGPWFVQAGTGGAPREAADILKFWHDRDVEEAVRRDREHRQRRANDRLLASIEAIEQRIGPPRDEETVGDYLARFRTDSDGPEG